MSIKSEWKRLERRLKEWWAELSRRVQAETRKAETKAEAAAEDAEGSAAPAGLPSPSLASCWEGSNAQTRHMNVLSFAFTDETVEKRFDWAKKRGCNTLHLFLCNQGDGEGSGFNIYGGTPSIGAPDQYSVARMANRIALAKQKGFSVVLWLMSDDSKGWNSVLLANPEKHADDLKRSGLLDLADAVVLGLELNEYANESQVAALAKAVRGVYAGKIGTHHTAGHADFAKHGDLLFWQTATGLDAEAVKRSVEAAKNYGKPVVAFELARNPQRELAQAALDAGAVGVGNW